MRHVYRLILLPLPDILFRESPIRRQSGKLETFEAHGLTGHMIVVDQSAGTYHFSIIVYCVHALGIIFIRF